MKSDKELKTKLQAAEFELLVPANNKQIAMQAIKAGADAIYIGYAKYGARIQAGNTMEDLVELIEFAHVYRAKVYITLNTILKNEEIKNIEKELKVGEYLGSINEIFYRENESNSIYVRIYDSAYYKFDLTTGELLDEFIVYNPYNDLQIN